MPPVHYGHAEFPPAILDLNRLLPLVGPANAELARYGEALSAIPNASILLAPLTVQEAVLSSKIEGTQATFGEVLEFEAGGERGSAAKTADINEVLNYRKAMVHAVELLKTLPLSTRVVKQAHLILMHGVRGSSKAPGEFRKTSNWIGPPGCTLETAHYVPISAERISDAMSKWERYLHADTPDKLIQLAILHAEFEMIHPFLDGNGRLGRLLVPLYLAYKQLLSGPDFYISSYLEANRDEYYDRLLAVSRDNDWTGWCEFFLRALIEQARSNLGKTTAILDLYEEKKRLVVGLIRSQYTIRALDWFFNRPIFKTTDFIAAAGIPKPTARRIVRQAEAVGLLRVLREGGGRRPSILVFPELINIAEGKEVFQDHPRH